MNPQRPTTPPTTAELTGLADGSLPAADRDRVAAAVARSPELQAGVEAQRRVVHAVRATATEPAPAALRMRLAASAGRTSARGRRRRLWRAGAAAVALAVVIAVVITTLGGGSPAPTVITAAALSSRPVQADIQEPRPGTMTLPGVRAAGLSFPDWSVALGYRALGVRRDDIAGRRTTTVYYRGAENVAYAIVSGPPLAVGGRTHGERVDGVWLQSLTRGARSIVTWVRRGHTCVLSGSAGSLPALLRLATWRGGGELLY